MCQFPCILHWQRHRERCPQCSDIHFGKNLTGLLYPYVHGLLTGKPIPLLWRLRVTLRQQIILMTIFTLAGL